MCIYIYVYTYIYLYIAKPIMFLNQGDSRLVNIITQNKPAIFVQHISLQRDRNDSTEVFVDR